MNVWVVCAQCSPKDLKRIMYSDIMETKGSKVLSEIYQELVKFPRLYVDPAPDFEDYQAVIFKSTPPNLNGKHQGLWHRTWHKLRMEFPLVKRCGRMLEDYQELKGRKVESFVITDCRRAGNGCGKLMDLYINTGGQGPGPKQVHKLWFKSLHPADLVALYRVDWRVCYLTRKKLHHDQKLHLDAPKVAATAARHKPAGADAQLSCESSRAKIGSPEQTHDFDDVEASEILQNL